MVSLERLEDAAEIEEVRTLIRQHIGHTGSRLAESVLARWPQFWPRFVRVMPRDYKRMLEAIARAEQAGLGNEEAVTAAFEANKGDLARIGGN
jgi:glutamate synthase (ferredoxin)